MQDTALSPAPGEALAKTGCNDDREAYLIEPRLPQIVLNYKNFKGFVVVMS